ncbi:6-carboxytetrahydropterin synthase [Hydrogenimonas sp.]|uniref:6-pyruvoyl trahydropterin synthase family protein n=1 Tax=Hydrogenimonas sp. TaxID=2231112 RepID=UPI0026235DD2|nr:6-carboxytetrahydropterin synthase [Hydrogenimonas sp.]
MTIRKLYKFENAHIVRGCSTRRCSRSIHGHSYKAEIFFTASTLDRGQMIYDFGLAKRMIGDFIDAFDHAITLWSEDDPAYIADMKKWSERWVELPLNPSVEQFARIFFLVADRMLQQTKMVNGEGDVRIESVIVHETETGYAKAVREDVYDSTMGPIELDRIEFSERVKEEWANPRMFDELLAGKTFVNPDIV